MDQNEATVWINEPTDVLAGRIVRCNWGADGDSTVLGDFRSDVADAADVDIAMLFREAKLRRKMLANQVSIEDGYRPSAHFQELRQQDVGDG